MPNLNLSLTDPQSMAFLMAVLFVAFAITLFRRVLWDMFKQATTRRLANRGRAKNRLPVRRGDRALGAHGEIRTLVRQLIADKAWNELGELMRQAEQDKALHGNGKRLSRVIVEAVTDPVRKVFDDGLRGRARDKALDQVLQPLRKGAKSSRGSADICSLAALALIEAAWAAHGAFDGRATSREGADMFHKLMVEARSWLKLADPDTGISTYYAEAHYMVAFSEDNTAAALADRFSRWTTLDPTDPRPYVQRALHLMPGWYGGLNEIAALGERALQTTAPTCGQGVYVQIIAALEPFLNVRKLPGYSDARVNIATLDLLKHTGSQTAANHWAAWAHRTGREQLALFIIRHHLEEMHRDQWTDEDDYAEFYALLSKAKAEEESAGVQAAPATA